MVDDVQLVHRTDYKRRDYYYLSFDFRVVKRAGIDSPDVFPRLRPDGTSENYHHEELSMLIVYKTEDQEKVKMKFLDDDEPDNE